MNRIREKMGKADYVLAFSMIALATIGVLFIYSSGIDNNDVLVSNEYVKQAVWAVVGVLAMVLIMMIDVARIKEYSPYLFLGILLILVYTLLFGKIVNGAKSWLGIGEIGIQPSEFMKIAFMFFLSFYLERNIHSQEKAKTFAFSLGILAVPVVFILAQPDFGTTLVFIPIYLSILYISGLDKVFTISILVGTLLTFFLTITPFWAKNIVKRELFFVNLVSEAPGVFVILGLCAVFFAISFFGYRKYRKKLYKAIAIVSTILLISVSLSYVGQRVLKDYQIKRLVVFLDPLVDKQGSGWNIIQSKTAIGSGGILGRGYLRGYQSHNRYVPQQSTDFIFTIISEEWGFLGGLLVFVIMFLILWRTLLAAKRTKDLFSALLCAGIFGMFFFHFMINIGMVMGIMPITGIPLFFLSYGGSSMLLGGIAVGIVESVVIHRYRT